METTDREREEQGPQAWFLSSVLLVILPLIYFLSAVPVIVIFYKNTGDVPWIIETAYSPVQWFYDNSESCKSFIDWQAKTMGLR